VGKEAATLAQTHVRTLALLAESKREKVAILARWGGGEPALVEVPMGEGRIAMLTTSLDRDGSDLVLRPSFVPFLQRMVAYLAGRFDRERAAEPQIGRPVRVEAPPGEGELVLTGPEGLEQVLEEKAVCSGSPATCDLGALDHAGSYAVFRKSDPTHRRELSLNVDREEGKVEAYEAPALRAHLQGTATQPAVAETSPAPELPPVPAGGEPLWPVALIALFGLLLAEAWFALRRV
jgi:hypothetical protein